MLRVVLDNGRKYCILNIPFAFGEPDFTFLDLELWQIGENMEAMAMQEEIIGGIRQLEGEIGELKGEIRGLENKQLLTPTDASLAVQISEKTALMTAKQKSSTAKTELLTALITSQQGNFSSHISIVLSQSSRCNPLPNLFRHLLFTHSGLANS